MRYRIREAHESDAQALATLQVQTFTEMPSDNGMDLTAATLRSSAGSHAELTLSRSVSSFTHARR